MLFFTLSDATQTAYDKNSHLDELLKKLAKGDKKALEELNTA